MGDYGFPLIDKSLAGPLAQYLAAHEEGIKKTRNAALDEFITAVRTLPADRFAAALELTCHLVFERNPENPLQPYFPVQYPLLRDLVYPYLVDAYREKRMPHTRWLAACADHEGVIAAATGGRTQEQLLREALALDPTDSGCWRQLAKEQLEILDFATHSPYGLAIREDVCRQALDALERILGEDADTERRYRPRHRFYSRLLDDWAAFESEVDVGSFEQWCEKNDRDYRFMPKFVD